MFYNKKIHILVTGLDICQQYWKRSIQIKNWVKKWQTVWEVLKPSVARGICLSSNDSNWIPKWAQLCVVSKREFNLALVVFRKNSINLQYLTLFLHHTCQKFRSTALNPSWLVGQLRIAALESRVLTLFNDLHLDKALQ